MVFLDNLRRKAPVLQDAHVHGRSHVGLVRAGNEDSFICINHPWSNGILVAVADGMGGHEFGEVASFLVMRYVLSAWYGRGDTGFEQDEDVLEFMRTVLQRANSHIFHINSELKIRWCMGTTVTLGVFFKERLVLGQIGDSRCYRLRRRKLKQLTADQSWQEEMVRNGVMNREEAGRHPLSNMLTNCVGAMKSVRIEYVTEHTHKDDRYLFCTDGLNGCVKHNRMTQVMQDADYPHIAVDELIKYALRGGGTDNVTAACLYM